MATKLLLFTKPIPETEAKPVISRFTDELTVLGADFYCSGWAPAATGNFSLRLSDDPFRVLITKKLADKAALSPADFVVVDETGAATEGEGYASADAAIHLAIMRATGMRAVLQTHSPHALVISERNARAHGVFFSGLEILSASMERHREWIPVLENRHGYRALSGEVRNTITRYPQSHGFFVRACGLFCWGFNIAEARRRIEALELLAGASVKVWGIS